MFRTVLIAAASARFVNVNYDGNSVKPLKTNVDATDIMARWNPRIFLRQGCSPMVAFTEDTYIAWHVGSKESAALMCYDLRLNQMYARFHMDPTFGNPMIIYAWRQLVDKKSTGQWRRSWSYMAVIPNVIDGVVQAAPKGIWTALDGYTEKFATDAGGNHPWIQQVRADSTKLAAIQANTVTSIDGGSLFTLIDVDGGGSFTDEGRIDMNRHMIPLSDGVIDSVVAQIKSGKALGYPVY